MKPRPSFEELREAVSYTYQAEFTRLRSECSKKTARRRAQQFAKKMAVLVNNLRARWDLEDEMKEDGCHED